MGPESTRKTDDRAASGTDSGKDFADLPPENCSECVYIDNQRSFCRSCEKRWRAIFERKQRDVNPLNECTHGVSLEEICLECMAITNVGRERLCSCHPGEAPKPCPHQFAVTECEQRQRDIEQLARDLFAGMGCDDNPWVKTDLSRAFDRAELFYTELDKRRAG